MSLEGDLSELPFAEIVQLYGTGRQPVAVHLRAPGAAEAGEGIFCLEEGKLTDARMGGLSGRDAFRQALRMQEGSFRVEMGVRATTDAKPELLTHLLLDELAKLEEDKASGAWPLTPAPAKPPIIVAPRRPQHTPQPIPVTTPLPQEAPRLTPQPQPAPATPAAAPAKSKVPLIAAAAVGAVVVVAVVAFLATRGGKDKGADPGANPGKPPGNAKVFRGVTPTEITFGMATPLNGPLGDLGGRVKVGVGLAFDEANAAGGVHGRKLSLVPLDDRNDPDASVRAVQELIEQRQVFAIVGNAGTATPSAPLPYLLQSKVIYFAPVSGLPALRKSPPDRYVFNYRPSLGEETGAALKYLVDVRKVPADKIAIFAEDDEFGEAGVAGLEAGLKKHGRDPAQVLRTGYARNSADVSAAVSKIRAAGQDGVRAVVMIATVEAASRFIERVRAFAPQTVFTSVSAVAAGELADRLKEAKVKVAGDLMITEVVPNPHSRATVVARYRKLFEDHPELGDQVGTLSLEGYIVGSLLVEALKRAGPDLDTEKLVTALEGVHDLDLGIGTKLSFGKTDHQASHKVWGTVLDASWSYEPVELE